MHLSKRWNDEKWSVSLCGRISRWNIVSDRCILSREADRQTRGSQSHESALLPAGSSSSRHVAITLYTSRLVCSEVTPTEPTTAGDVDSWQLVDHITLDARRPSRLHAPRWLKMIIRCRRRRYNASTFTTRTLITGLLHAVCYAAPVCRSTCRSGSTVPPCMTPTIASSVWLSPAANDLAPSTNYSCLAIAAVQEPPSGQRSRD